MRKEECTAQAAVLRSDTMKRTTTKDEFYGKQPSLGFVEYLKRPVHEKKPTRFAREKARADEVRATGLYIENLFPDPEGLLNTATEDFEAFSKVCGIGGERFPIRLVKGNTPCFEAYSVEVTEEGCTVTANDTEGIRRAIVYLEDEMTAREGPFLPLGRIERRPWLKSRVTRGFFSPTNRPPKNGDELLDDIDYYPDEYLNRLAHDGTNGLWIYTSYKQLVPSDIITEYGADYEKRVAKLNRVIEKCRRYGIKVFAFMIEPAGLAEGLGEKYADMIGYEGGGVYHYSMCPNSRRVQEYTYEAGKRLFTLCPNLAGFISITAGERLTSCASNIDFHLCPRCRGMKRGDILAKNIKNLFAGMLEAKPDAECVSWTYGHRRWSDADILDYVAGAPDSVYLMQNFDDRGFTEQLGRERQAMDYWLSYIGPSGLFETTAAAAKENGKGLWAKMQICSSHEIATLPYVPSPAHVFGKVKEAFRLGVSGIMECWYFGNYPCFMSRAVGDLAFCHDFSDKDGYLRSLAAKTYGEGVADAVMRAWRFFEEGYAQYPVNIMFSYYSPAHDGVVWELSLKPKNYSLSRSWLLLDKPDGDRIEESILTGHTLDEAITLITEMKKQYERAMAELNALKSEAGHELSDLLSVGSAIYVLAKSTLNILTFYRLRDALGTGEGEPRTTLAKMRELVLAEIGETRAMITLCEKDARLGYHSEAEGYKFFPDKLRHRIKTLEDLLATEFSEVEERIDAGLPPLEYYLGIEEDCKAYYTIDAKIIEDAAWEPLSDGTTFFRIADGGEDLVIEVKAKDAEVVHICPEFRLFKVFPPISVELSASGNHALSTGWLLSEHWPYHKPEAQAALKDMWNLVCLPSTEGGEPMARLTIRKDVAGLRGSAPFKLRVGNASGAEWTNEPVPVCTLGKVPLVPGRFGFVTFSGGVAYEYSNKK